MLSISFVHSQKKELRNANKFYESGEFSSAIDLLDSSKSLFDSSEDKIRAQVTLLYGKIYTTMEDFDLAVKSFEMSKSLGTSRDVLDFEINKLETAIITSAVGDNETEDYDSAANKLKLVYDINPEMNQQYLYYAASSAVKPPDICPEPPKIASLMTGALTTLLSSMIANGLPIFAFVTLPNFFAPILSNLKLTTGSLVCGSKPG